MLPCGEPSERGLKALYAIQAQRFWTALSEEPKLDIQVEAVKQHKHLQHLLKKSAAYVLNVLSQETKIEHLNSSSAGVLRFELEVHARMTMFHAFIESR